MKYMAIDYGLKRTGIAVSDSGGHMAFARSTLLKRTRAEFFEQMLKIIEAENPVAVVIGVPYYMDGQPSLMTKQVLNFIASLHRRISLPIYLMDERLSSFAAEADLHENQLNRAAIKACVDQQAAVHILNSFLNLDIKERKIYE